MKKNEKNGKKLKKNGKKRKNVPNSGKKWEEVEKTWESKRKDGEGGKPGLGEARESVPEASPDAFSCIIYEDLVSCGENAALGAFFDGIRRIPRQDSARCPKNDVCKGENAALGAFFEAFRGIPR
jgi:hypothetical protein